MTNLVFPTEPLSSADIKVVAGSTQVTGIKGIELNEARPR